MMTAEDNQLTKDPTQYRRHPEQAISCAGREGNGKCGANTKQT